MQYNSLHFLPWWHTNIIWEKFLTRNNYVGPLSKDNTLQLYCKHKFTFILINWYISTNQDTITWMLYFTIDIIHHCLVCFKTIYLIILSYLVLGSISFGSSCNKWYVFYVLVLEGIQCSNKSYERYDNRNVRIAHNIEYLSTCIKSSYKAISIVIFVRE